MLANKSVIAYLLVCINFSVKIGDNVHYLKKWCNMPEQMHIIYCILRAACLLNSNNKMVCCMRIYMAHNTTGFSFLWKAGFIEWDMSFYFPLLYFLGLPQKKKLDLLLWKIISAASRWSSIMLNEVVSFWIVIRIFLTNYCELFFLLNI